MDCSAFRSSSQVSREWNHPPGHPNMGLNASLDPPALGSALVAGDWEPAGPRVRSQSFGDLALCPHPGQKCAVAILFLVITTRALGSPVILTQGLGPSFRPLEEESPSPEHNSSSSASELRASFSISLPSPPPPLSSTHSLGSPVPMVFLGCGSQEPPVPAVNLYLLHRPLLAPDSGLV